MALTGFQLPGGESLRSRKSAIRSLFVRSLIPGISPSDADYATALRILRQRPGAPLTCSYCGDPATEWDHLHPVMRDGQPTGYLTIIQNLVPACGKCNQSKGNRHWRAWMTGPAPQSPATRGIRDIRRRMRRLSTYDEWGSQLRIDFADELSADLIRAHFERLESVLALLDEADEHSSELRQQLAESLPESLPSPKPPSLWRRLWSLLFRR